MINQLCISSNLVLIIPEVPTQVTTKIERSISAIVYHTVLYVILQLIQYLYPLKLEKKKYGSIIEGGSETYRPCDTQILPRLSGEEYSIKVEPYVPCNGNKPISQSSRKAAITTLWRVECFPFLASS